MQVMVIETGLIKVPALIAGTFFIQQRRISFCSIAIFYEKR